MGVSPYSVFLMRVLDLGLGAGYPATPSVTDTVRDVDFLGSFPFCGADGKGSVSGDRAALPRENLGWIPTLVVVGRS